MQTKNWDNYPLVLNTKEVAEILSLSPGRIYAMMKDGTLPKIQVGKVHKVYRDALRRWLEGTPA